MLVDDSTCDKINADIVITWFTVAAIEIGEYLLCMLPTMILQQTEC